jgi:PEP-CTERM/exosortase A-associated glycosyltransferase
MRILHVLDHSLPLHSGYTFRTRAIMKAQVARGWDVAGLTGVRQGGGQGGSGWGGGSGQGDEVVEDLRFFRTPAPPAARSPLREWREIKALRARLEQVVEEFRPDLIHVHSPVLGALAAQPVATRRRIPLLYEIRAFWEDAAVGNGTGREGSWRYRATKALETRAVRRADAVAVICEGLRADLVARGIDGAKIVVSPNGVDLGLFGSPAPADAALASQLGLGDDDEVAGYVGSFYDYEGLDDLIAAMPALVAARPRARLLLVGGGPMEDAVRAQAAASPVADRHRLRGPGTASRGRALLPADRHPGLSAKGHAADRTRNALKPLEAMAQGRLVAASSVGGHRELIRTGSRARCSRPTTRRRCRAPLPLCSPTAALGQPPRHRARLRGARA